MKQQKVKWRKLDNASKVFPATCNNRDTKVFRLACELNDLVEPEVLQHALELTLENFPLYRSVLRRGVFWYYFESSDIKPLVEMENQPLCAPIYIKDRRNLQFRVSYYHKRINLEVFHALTDGAGVIWFMESLIYYYMINRYKNLSNEIPKINYKASISQKMADSFAKNFSKSNPPKKSNKKRIATAHRVKGTRMPENRMNLIEGAMSVKKILELAHKYDTTLTIFTSSLLLYSIFKDMDSNSINKPVVLSVPINLRQYFESYTARNFFSTMNIDYDFKNKSPELEDIIKYVGESFKNGLSKEELDYHLYRLMAFETNPLARVIPLTLKDLTLKFVNKYTDRGITSSISNIGRINMPPEFTPYIHQFTICVSARRPQVTMCSYNDRLVISFITPFEETDIQRTFFQFLANNGVDVEITSNL